MGGVPRSSIADLLDEELERDHSKTTEERQEENPSGTPEHRCPECHTDLPSHATSCAACGWVRQAKREKPDSRARSWAGSGMKLLQARFFGVPAPLVVLGLVALVLAVNHLRYRALPFVATCEFGSGKQKRQFKRLVMCQIIGVPFGLATKRALADKTELKSVR